MISNHKRLYKKSTNEYFLYTSIYKNIHLKNDNGNKEQKRIIKLIKETFQLKYDYIYYDENFYTIPSLTAYGLSNYNRVIKYDTGNIFTIYKDNNTLYVYQIWYDNGQRCCDISIQKLWNKVNNNEETLDCIEGFIT